MSLARNEEYTHSKISKDFICKDYAYLHSLSTDDFLLIILEKYCDNNLSYIAIKVNIARERAVSSCPPSSNILQVNDVLLSELKEPHYTYVTGTVIIPSQVDDFEKAINSHKFCTELYEGRVSFVCQLFRPVFETQYYTINALFQVGDSPIFTNKNVQNPYKQTMDLFSNEIGKDERLASSWSWKCSIL
jgi:hypothetical protein